jgi:hypothetical protein
MKGYLFAIFFASSDKKIAALKNDDHLYSGTNLPITETFLNDLA